MRQRRSKLFRHTFEQAAVGLAHITPAGRFLRLNRRFGDILGYSPAEMLKRTFQEITYPDDLETDLAQLQQVLAHEIQSYSIEKRYIRRDGSLVWVNLTVSLVRRPDGAPDYFIQVIEDITPRKRVEEALRHSDERYRRLFEEAPVMYVITRNQAGLPIIEDCNNLFLSKLGYSRAEVIGQPLTQFYTPDSCAKLLEGGYQRGLEGFFTVEERELLTRTGRVVPVLLRALPETTPEGQVQGTRAMYVDIGDFKQMEATLRANEERFRQVVASISDHIYVSEVNSEGRFLNRYISPNVAKLTGYPQAEFIANWCYWGSLIHPDDREVAAGQIERLSRGQSSEVEYRLTRADGQIIWLRDSARVESEGPAKIIYGVVSDITGRKRAEEALCESEQKFSTLFQRAAFAATLVSLPEGIMVDVNEAWLQLSGYTRPEMIGKTTLELNLYPNPEDRARSMAAFNQQGWVRNQEVALRMKSGEVRILSVNSDWVDIGGQKYILNTAQDITERKQAEERLAYQASLLANVNDAIIAADAQFILTAWNPAAEQMYGWKAAEVLGKLSAEVVRSDSPAQSRAEMIRTLAETGQFQGEVIQYRQDGTPFPVEARTIVLKDAAGKTTGYVSVNRDITARKQAEMQLAERQKFLEAIMVTIPDIVYLYHVQQQRHIYFNKDMESLLGYSTEEIKRMGADLILKEVHPEDLPRVMNHIETLAKTQGNATYELEYRIKGKGGNYLWFYVREQVYQRDQAQQPEILFGVCQDITERKQAEESLRQARERLETLSRQLLEAQEVERRRLARELHDEIGQSLSMVKIDLHMVQQLLQPTGLTKPLNESVDLVERTLQQVRALSVELRPSLLDDLGLVPALRWYVDRQAQRGGFTARFEADPLPERLAPELETVCFRLVQEALTNVLRYAQANQVDVELKLGQAELHLLVRDEGVGFDAPAALARAAQGGSMGLLGMQERAALVGGRLEIQAAPGRGAEIRATLPLKYAAPAEAEA